MTVVRRLAVCAATVMLTAALPCRAAAQHGASHFILSVGPTWRSTSFEPGDMRIGAAGRVAVEFPSEQGRTTFEASISASGYPGTAVIVAAAQSAPPAARGTRLNSAPSFFFGGTPNGPGDMATWEFAGLFRWYAHAAESGPYLGLGGGAIAIGENNRTRWRAAGEGALGYAFRLDGRHRLVLEERFEYMGAGNAPTWLAPLTVGVSWAVGR